MATTVAMRIDLGLLAAMAVIAGLGLLASSGPPRPVRSSVVLNPAPPPPTGPLSWDAWPPLAAEREATGGSSPQLVPAAAPEEPAAMPAAAPVAVWATPAEFAESD